jgi:hypothetical protein
LHRSRRWSLFWRAVFLAANGRRGSWTARAHTGRGPNGQPPGVTAENTREIDVRVDDCVRYFLGQLKCLAEGISSVISARSPAQKMLSSASLYFRLDEPAAARLANSRYRKFSRRTGSDKVQERAA